MVASIISLPFLDISKQNQWIYVGTNMSSKINEGELLLTTFSVRFYLGADIRVLMWPTEICLCVAVVVDTVNVCVGKGGKKTKEAYW